MSKKGGRAKIGTPGCLVREVEERNKDKVYLDGVRIAGPIGGISVKAK